MIRTLLLLIYFLLIGFSVKSQDAKSNTQEALFNLHKRRFVEFEKQHRGVIKFKNHQLSYLKWGDNTQKVFVWLPGSLLSAYDFYPFAEKLMKDGYTVISVDHYGHGLTEMPQEDLDFWDFADDLTTLLDQMQINSVVIGGFSRGGYLASAFYEKYPEKVKAIVLEEGGSVSFKAMFDKLSKEEFDVFANNLEPPIQVQELLFDEYDSEFEVFRNLSIIDGSDSQWQNFGFVRKKGEKYIMYQGLNEYMHMQDRLHYLGVLNQAKDVSRYASSIVRVDPAKIYKSLSVPMLIIEATGQPDFFDTTLENQKLKDLHPDRIRHVQFDCDSHNIHFGCPDRFILELREFLNGIEVSP